MEKCFQWSCSIMRRMQQQRDKRHHRARIAVQYEQRRGSRGEEQRTQSASIVGVQTGAPNAACAQWDQAPVALDPSARRHCLLSIQEAQGRTGSRHTAQVWCHRSHAETDIQTCAPSSPSPPRFSGKDYRIFQNSDQTSTTKGSLQNSTCF